NSSTLNTSNALETVIGTIVSGFGPGTLAMTNSTFTPHLLITGSYSDGTATFVNSTVSLGAGLNLANVGGHTGTMTINGGQCLVTNTHSGFFQNLVTIGDRGSGQLTISKGKVQFGNTTIGNIVGSS